MLEKSFDFKEKLNIQYSDFLQWLLQEGYAFCNEIGKNFKGELYDFKGQSFSKKVKNICNIIDDSKIPFKEKQSAQGFYVANPDTVYCINIPESLKQGYAKVIFKFRPYRGEESKNSPYRYLVTIAGIEFWEDYIYILSYELFQSGSTFYHTYVLRRYTQLGEAVSFPNNQYYIDLKILFNLSNYDQLSVLKYLEYFERPSSVRGYPDVFLIHYYNRNTRKTKFLALSLKTFSPLPFSFYPRTYTNVEIKEITWKDVLGFYFDTNPGYCYNPFATIVLWETDYPETRLRFVEKIDNNLISTTIPPIVTSINIPGNFQSSIFWFPLENEDSTPIVTLERRYWRNYNIAQHFFFDKFFYEKSWFPIMIRNQWVNTKFRFEGKLKCSAGSREKTRDVYYWVILIADDIDITWIAETRIGTKLDQKRTCPKVIVYPTGHFLMNWSNWGRTDIMDEEKRFIDWGALHIYYANTQSEEWTYSDHFQDLDVDFMGNWVWSIAWYQNRVTNAYHHKKYEFKYPIKRKIIGLKLPYKVAGLIEEIVIKNGDIPESPEYRLFWQYPTYNEIVRIPAHSYNQYWSIYAIVNVTNFNKLNTLINSKDLRLSISPCIDYPSTNYELHNFWGIDSDHEVFQQYNIVEIPTIICGKFSTGGIPNPFSSYIPWDFYYDFYWLELKYQSYYGKNGFPNCFDLYYYDYLGRKIGIGPIVDCAMGNGFSLGK